MTASLRKRDRIREHLIALIEARAVGQAIPSERQLASELGVSRPTLHAVVDGLVRDGWLVREHGRSVFVGTPKIAQQIVVDRAAYPPAPGKWTSRVLDRSGGPTAVVVDRRSNVAGAQRLDDDRLDAVPAPAGQATADAVPAPARQATPMRGMRTVTSVAAPTAPRPQPGKWKVSQPVGCCAPMPAVLLIQSL